MIDELSALRKIEEKFHTVSKGVEVGIGDDAAAVKITPGGLLLVTTDSQVEGVHFTKTLISADTLARKSVAVSVSDIGAMGGVPRYILASVGFSGDEDEDYLSQMINGFRESEKEFGVELIGGNLSSSAKLFLDITSLGEVEPENVVKRTGASEGDLIYVSGTLGDSALGLTLLQEGVVRDESKKLIERHMYPRPRLELGRQLAVRRAANSMIDVSDGLLLDLGRITVDKGLGARIYADKLPLSGGYKSIVSDYTECFYELALSGGEDYELLFTTAQDNKDYVSEIASSVGTDITEIGIVNTAPAIEIIDSNGDEIKLNRRGFTHFNN
jgi:thiamine-monophosphate kinase